MFTGFFEQTPDFLWNLRFNNNKEWFLAHKQDYQTYVQQPLRELANEVYDAMSAAHPELNLNLHISRIYRDARRLFGRGPMKDHLWFSIFTSENGREEAPSFFFGIEPEEIRYGMGYWGPTAGTMARFRQAILDNPAPMRKLVRAFDRQDQFQLAGPLYARSKGAVEPLLQTWFDRKEITLLCRHDHDEFTRTPALSQAMREGFEVLLPMYRYLLMLAHRAE